MKNYHNYKFLDSLIYENDSCESVRAKGTVRATTVLHGKAYNVAVTCKRFRIELPSDLLKSPSPLPSLENYL
jgi:hypothetical protein